MDNISLENKDTIWIDANLGNQKNVEIIMREI